MKTHHIVVDNIYLEGNFDTIYLRLDEAFPDWSLDGTWDQRRGRGVFLITKEEER